MIKYIIGFVVGMIILWVLCKLLIKYYPYDIPKPKEIKNENK